MKWILASASPRRKEILDQVGAVYEVCPSNAAENTDQTLPSEIVMELAWKKAEEVAGRNKGREELLVLGADTIVACGSRILFKPKDEEDAFSMLSLLSGKKHQVYTGVALIWLGCDGKQKDKKNYSVKTDVYVRELSEEQIWDYIATGEPADKAGAYGIQGSFARYIDRMEGDYYNVVGLPISSICKSLEQMALDEKLLLRKRGGSRE